MKKSFLLPVLAASALGMASFAGAAEPVTDASIVNAVRPLIGTAEHGHTFPGACVPFGMVQLSPDTRNRTWDGASGYHHSDAAILGFSHNHLSGTGVGDLGNFLFLPTLEPVTLRGADKPGESYRAAFSHADETASPGYYRVKFAGSGIVAELTATTRAGFHRYTFPPSAREAHVIVDLKHGVEHDANQAGLRVENDHTLTGWRRATGWGGERTYYFVAEFSRPFAGFGIQADGPLIAGSTQDQGEKVRGRFDFAMDAGGQVLVKVGVSENSLEGARANLRAEIADFDFDRVRGQAGSAWSGQLGRMDAKFAREADRETFYTALYHAQIHPNVINDLDGSFFGPDNRSHPSPGFPYYSTLSLWDTFRSEHALLNLIAPERTNDILKTMLLHSQIHRQHFLPFWTHVGQETWCMIGNPAIPVIAEAYAKGFRDFDAEAALAAMKHSATATRAGLPEYAKLGYISPTGTESPAYPQTVSRTLEYAYADACAAVFAEALGKKEDAAFFAKRARNFRNVFDAKTGFMRPKSADGTWVEPFDPAKIDPIGFTEANGWHYLWTVMHDVPALIELLGGDEQFVAKLDELFTTKEKVKGDLVDVSGLIGQYAHGNEPCHHVAYLYSFAGAPWKTQERVRQIMGTLYDNTPAGLCGNDDCGQMSAWYVWSALGMYPVDPAANVYIIGSPLVESATIHLQPGFTRGREFRILAPHNSPTNVYIQSATLNGQPLHRSWLSHEELTSGGELVLEMGAEPNRSWGASAADRPMAGAGRSR